MLLVAIPTIAASHHNRDSDTDEVFSICSYLICLRCLWIVVVSNAFMHSSSLLVVWYYPLIPRGLIYILTPIFVKSFSRDRQKEMNSISFVDASWGQNRVVYPMPLSFVYPREIGTRFCSLAGWHGSVWYLVYDYFAHEHWCFCLSAHN